MTPKINDKVRIPDGRIGVIIRERDGQGAVKVDTKRLWELLWFPLRTLDKVT